MRLLQTSKVRFTQPIEFNDPFEMQPFLECVADQATIEKQFHQHFDATVRRELTTALERLTPEQRARVDSVAIENAVRQQTPEALNMLKQFAGVVTPVIGAQIYKTVNESLGVFCLTEHPANLLMWAHYADNHRGAVIGFDASHPFFNRRRGPDDDFRHFRRVVYRQERPVVSLSNSDAADFFYFKSLEWQYEDEWRLIVPLADCSERIESTNGYPICLFQVPAECMRLIILGCRMPEEWKYKLVEIARSEQSYRHICFQQAETDKRVFEVRRRTIDADRLDEWISR
jgi:Protein of unknown function (DUF2971)